MAWWIDGPDDEIWIGPFQDQDEALEQCVTWFKNSTVRWLPDD